MFNQMSSFSKSSSSSTSSDEEIVDLRRGPWTMEEDNLLVRYIVGHGEGRWNNLAKCSGLKRTGKSCRLRWLNYLKPDVKRGNLTPQEQLLILQLYSKWGNRWSKIAKQLPGRTDNEIKNYWRTRVQKQARHLKIDTNSTKFQDMIQCIWMPRLLEKIQQSPSVTTNHQSLNHPSSPHVQAQMHHGLDLDHMNSSSGEVFTDCSLDQFMHFPQVTHQVLSGSPISPLCADEYDIFVNMESAEAEKGANILTHEEIEVSLWNMDELWELQEMEN